MSRSRRAIAVASSAAGFASDALRYAVRQPFLDEDHRAHARHDLQAAAGRRIMQAAGQMRGTALKLAQALAWEVGLLPEATTAELSRAWYDAPPLGPALAERTLSEALGAHPFDVFERFELQPFAAASLGQVHGASTRGGEAVAVKLKYPGIEHDIDADVRAVKRLFEHLPSSGMLLELLEEIHLRLREECDYRREAKQLIWFGRRLEPLGVRVPELRTDYCGPGVLTTTRLPGTHLRQWLETNPPQADRDRAAARIYDVFWRGLCDFQRMHADPNPGNYLFASGGAVGMLDFGCVKKVPASFSQLMRELIMRYLEGDEDGAFDCAREGGLFGEVPVAHARRVDETCLRPFARWLTRPMRESVFSFAAHPRHAFEGRALFLEIMRANPNVPLYREFVFVNRTLCGLYLMFQDLGANVALRHPHLCRASGGGDAG